MRWNSFRVRLTLWNVAVLALVLGGFGLALCYSIQTWMSRNIDRELAERPTGLPSGGSVPPRCSEALPAAEAANMRRSLPLPGSEARLSRPSGLVFPSP